VERGPITLIPLRKVDFKCRGRLFFEGFIPIKLPVTCCRKRQRLARMEVTGQQRFRVVRFP